MKNITELIKESWSSNDNRAKTGNVLEVELRLDGHFLWHTPEDKDWNDWAELTDWEAVRTSENSIAIKIGNLEDLKEF